MLALISISESFLTILFFLVICLLTQKNIRAQPIFYHHECQNDTQQHASTNATYEFSTNLSVLFSTLSSNAATDWFGNATIGNTTSGPANTTTIYGQYICRFDSGAVCPYCILTAGQEILRRCPNNVTAIIWYNYCTIRYSDVNFFGTVSTTPFYTYFNTSITSYEPGEINKVEDFTRGLIFNATGSSLNLAASVVDLSATKKWYGLAQCVRDINASECSGCLLELLSHDGREQIAVRLLAPSCMIRRDIYLFYQLNQTTGLDYHPETDKKRRTKKSTILIISITSLLLVAVISICIYCLYRRNGKDGLEPEISLDHFYVDTTSEDSLKADLPMMPLSTIQQSTNNFWFQYKLGEGGFGSVYKGILPDGRQVAIKRLSETSHQGLEEFKNEVIFIAKLQHRNLVRLLACCIEENEKLLVYEYMPNASLDCHLFNKARRRQLNWKLRLNIIHGIARGLCYLHEDSSVRLIHRDLKASNILLDDKMNPKISDFGLARAFRKEEGHTKTRRVVGTYGYMAPEYVMVGIFSIKSDIFSFGVLLLEIISGKRNNGHYFSKHGQSLLKYAWRLWNEGKALMLMDPLLETPDTPSEIVKCIHIGLLCVQEDAADRPTMPTIIVMLSSETVILPSPKQPAFSMGKAITEQESTLNNSISCSVDDATISNMEPR